MQFARITRAVALQFTPRRCQSSLPEHTKIIMPKVSPTMTSGRLVTWKKKQGDAIEEGEDIVDIESDKATMPIEARDDGYMAKIFVDEDTPDIPLGRLLAIVVEEQQHIEAFKHFKAPEEEESSSPSPSPSSTSDASTSIAGAPLQQLDNTKKYEGPIGPAVLRLLNQHKGLNLDLVTSTGPKGRILKGDVLAAIESGIAFSPSSSTASVISDESTPSTPRRTDPQAAERGERAKYTDTSVTSMRRAIAKRLDKTNVPHQYASMRYGLDNVSAFRERVLNSTGVKVSVNDVIIKAVAVALTRVPQMNMRWDVTTASAMRNETVDISMAVAIDGGLITPIVTKADRRGLVDIANVTKDLMVKAREGSLAPEQFEGGCFSVSNLGMLGVSHFSAIINPPQSGILAVGCPLEVPRIDNDGKLTKATEGVATLSSDARVVSEEVAAKFLEEFSNCMSKPQSMMM